MQMTKAALVALALSAGAAGSAMAQSNVYPEATDCGALLTQADRITCRAQMPATGWKRPDLPYKSSTTQPDNSGTYQQAPSYPPADSNAPGTRKVQPIQPRVGGGQ